jgi:cytochrome c6
MLVVLVLALGLAGPVLAAPSGAELFEAHCAGCHVNGGNIIRRGKTLRLAALERQGVASEAAIAAIAAAGVGQMSGYAGVLGEEGVAAVAAWVWQQAQTDWPRA